MLLKLLILFGICFVAIDSQLSQDDLCFMTYTKNYTEEYLYNNFYVRAAYRFREFLGLIGYVWKEANPSDNHSVALRVKIWHPPGPSEQGTNEFYETRFWFDVQKLYDQRYISYWYDVRGVNVFKPQHTTEMVYFLENKTYDTAIQFNYDNVLDMTETNFKPTFDVKSDVKYVYSHQKPYDHSGVLRLKQLYSLFPPPYEVLSIIIFDRMMNKDRGTGQLTYHAIVYTVSVHTNTFYYRHYMRSERDEFVDDRGYYFIGLQWSFDDTMPGGDQIHRRVTDVVVIRNDDQIVNNTIKRTIIPFMEFYGTKHKLMQIVFWSADDPKWEVKALSTGDGDNAKAFIHCLSHDRELDNHYFHMFQLTNNLDGDLKKFIIKSGKNYEMEHMDCVNGYYRMFKINRDKVLKEFKCENGCERALSCCANFTLYNMVKDYKHQILECTDWKGRQHLLTDALDGIWAEIEAFCFPDFKFDEHLVDKCYELRLSINAGTAITVKELCHTDATGNWLNIFRVEAAFKFREFLGLIGHMWRDSDPSFIYSVALRVKHWHTPGPSEFAINGFYEARIWNDIKKIDEQKKIHMGFSSRGMFDNYVFLVQDQNLTTSIKFNYDKVLSMAEPTYDEKTDKVVVYDPKEVWDDSGILRIKYLYSHFPHPVKILSLMVFDRMRTSDANPIYHAIVYTKEYFGGNIYYIRHYMRSELKQYNDGQGFSFTGLRWTFDQNMDFCDEITSRPTAVTLLRQEEHIVNAKFKRTLIYFLEFYGHQFKLMKIEFWPVENDRYEVIEMDFANNSFALINCRTHDETIALWPMFGLLPEIRRFIPEGQFVFSSSQIDCLNKFYNMTIDTYNSVREEWHCMNGCQLAFACCANYTTYHRVKEYKQDLLKCLKWGNGYDQDKANILEKVLAGIYAEMEVPCYPDYAFDDQLREKCYQLEQYSDITDGITQGQLCDWVRKGQKVVDFNVDVAFKFKDFFGLIGHLTHRRLKVTSSASIRIRSWHPPGPSETAINRFYETRVWNDIHMIHRNSRIKYAFSTREVTVFDNQKTSDLVFLVQDQNLTTAYQFDYQKVLDMPEPTFDEKTDKMVVYDPKEVWDDSGILRIKYLYSHFPHPIKILCLLLFERSISANLTKHYAIVYTEEGFGRQTHYTRNYMRSELRQYKSKTGEIYTWLKWTFDETVDYCDELGNRPTAVILLNTDEEMVETSNNTSKRTIIYFIEFFGLKHMINKIIFEKEQTKRYVIKEYHVPGQSENNARVFLNCETHDQLVEEFAPKLLPDIRKYFPENQFRLKDTEINCVNDYYKKAILIYQDVKRDFGCVNRCEREFSCCVNFTTNSQLIPLKKELASCVGKVVNEYLNKLFDGILNEAKLLCGSDFKFPSIMKNKCIELKEWVNRLSDKQLCELHHPDHKANLKIYAAFKFNDYFGVLGKVEYQNGSYTRVAFLAMSPLVTEGSQIRFRVYYAPKIWNDLLIIGRKHDVKYAFSTYSTLDNKAFIGQKYTDMVYFVEEHSMVTNLYQFHPDRVEKMSPLPTYDDPHDVMVVYDPKADYDRSGFFRLKYLFAHFPNSIEIKAVVIFPRFGKRFKSLPVRRSPVYYAIVYTEELYKEKGSSNVKELYVRHYFRAEHHRYRDYYAEPSNEETWFTSLDWIPDKEIDYCEQITRAPDAVAVIRTEEYFVVESNDYEYVLNIIEMYGHYHAHMIAKFPISSSDFWVFEQQEQGIRNMELINRCEFPPGFMEPLPIECEDYENKEDSGIVKLFLKSRPESNFILYAIGFIVLSILILIGVFVYKALKSDKN